MWVEPCIIPCVAISQLPPPSRIACVSQIIKKESRSAIAILGTESTFMNYQHKDSNVILPPIYLWKTNKAENLRHIAKDDDHPAVSKPEQQPVSDIVEWMQVLGPTLPLHHKNNLQE